MEKAFGDIPADLKSRLLSAAVPTISAVLFKKGFNSRFFAGLQPLSEKASRFCGPAWTVRAIPVREDLRAKIASGELPSLNRLAFDAAPAGSVLVCSTGGHPDVAVMGDIMTTSLMVRGVAGAVVDTGVSDANLIAQMAFPLVCTGSAPVSSFAKVMVADHGLPIGIGDVAVFPGDIIVGDPNGAVCIPRDIADAVADAAVEQEALEAFILARVQSGAPLEGTYPPNAETLAAYRAWRATQTAQ
ncbi:MAG: ribonuclease activity regulator RraA [Rhodospirillales bacterium]|jgi:regulator of RNase E activity RraA|nr:ribonuclease activity regulator RraA [Magnetospirillum sp.]